MARLLVSELEQLTQSVSMQLLAEACGVTLEHQGVDLQGRCPFHDDPTLSLVIHPRENRWECRGTCQAEGTVVDWVMRAEGVSRRHAVELLQAGYRPSAVPTRTAPPRASSVPKLPAPVTAAAEDTQAVLRQVVAYYHATLEHAPEARRYLDGRGLPSAELCAHFQLGYANRTLGYRLPQKNRRAGAALRGSLQRLGILRASGHEHFSGALVIPIVTPDGAVVQLVGRRIGTHLDAGAPRHLALPDRPPGIWNEEALNGSQTIILCASLFDAFTFWVAGFRQVVASDGGTGLTDLLQAALQAHGITTVTLAYGSTPTQARAARAHADRLLDSMTSGSQMG